MRAFPIATSLQTSLPVPSHCSDQDFNLALGKQTKKYSTVNYNSSWIQTETSHLILGNILLFYALVGNSDS